MELFVVIKEEEINSAQTIGFPQFVFLTEKEADDFVKEKDENKEYGFYSYEATVAGPLLDFLRGNREFGFLNVDNILKYDSERTPPAATSDIAFCLRQIADKPHRAPLYLQDLLEGALKNK